MRLFLFCLIVFTSSLVNAQTRWWRYASLPEGGKIIDLACTNSGKLYALAPNSVVYYSDNDGLAWKKIEGTYDFWNATNIEVDKVTGTLYVGTLTDGLDWTSDNGVTWGHEPFYTNSTTGFHAYIATAAKKGGTGRIVAIENLTTAAKAYRTSNNGVSWSNATCPFSATYKMLFTPNGSLYTGTENGVYQSLDDGQSFTAINSDMAGLKVTALAADNIHLIAGVSFNFTTLDTSGSGVYISTNGGASWSKMSNGLTDRRITALVIDSSSNKIYAGTTSSGVFVSADWGASWSPINSGLASKSISGAVHTPAGMFVSSLQSGVAFSANPAAGWNYRNAGLSISGIAGMVVSWSGDVHVLDGGTAGIYGRQAGSWRQQNNGLPAASGTSIAISSSGIIYSSFLPGFTGLFKTQDSGNSWTNIAPAIAATSNMTYVSYDAIKPDGANGLYVLTTYHGSSLPVIEEVFYSANGGSSWNSVYKTFDTSAYRIIGINVAHTGAFYVTRNSFFGTIEFFVSIDHGISFSPLAVNSSITSPRTSLVIDHNDSLYIIQNNSIIRRNGINNWTPVINGGWSTDVSYHPVKLFFDNSNNAFVSCKNDGMYYSSNLSAWSDITQGIPKYDYAPDSVRLTLTDLQFDNANTPYALAADSKAGTIQGIYKFSVPTSVGNVLAHSAYFVVYPNPAINELRLTGDVLQGDRYFIYDITGRLLDEQNIDAQKQIDISKLLKGTYTIAVQIKGKTSYQPFIKE